MQSAEVADEHHTTPEEDVDLTLTAFGFGSTQRISSISEYAGPNMHTRTLSVHFGLCQSYTLEGA